MKDKLKILILHNFYQQRGGEDFVFESEMALLNSYGHNISLFTENNNLIKTFYSMAKTFFYSNYSKTSKNKLKKILHELEPDIVHVHNFFPLLTPSIYDACNDKGIPVVQTLHNYRIICPGGLLLRDGLVCEKCIKGSAYQAVIHKCYKNSYLGSLSVANMVEKHRNIGTWEKKVTKYIALTEFAKTRFVMSGIPENKILIKPNFVFDLKKQINNKNLKRSGALFVGRLSQEKGISTLIKAWQKINFHLRVLGTGPLENKIKESKNKFINLLGVKDQKIVRAEMSKAAFLIMPSEWYEGFPIVLVESFSQGLPIIVSGLGSLAEIVQDGFNGLHFEHGNANDLAEKVRWMIEHPDECKRMSKNARNSYLNKYTPEKNYSELISIYKTAIEESNDTKS